HSNIPEGQNSQHADTEINELRGVSKHMHQIVTEEKQEYCNHGRNTHGYPYAMFCTFFHAIEALGTYVLPCECGHGVAKGEIGHHGKTVNTHDNYISRDDHLAEAV